MLSNHLCLFLLVNLAFAKAMYNNRSVYLQHNPDFDRHICSNHSFQLQSESLIQCGLFCQSKESCKSVFFDEDNNKCTGCKSKRDGRFYVDEGNESTRFYEINTVYPDATTTAVMTTVTSDSTVQSSTEEIQVIKNDSPGTTNLIITDSSANGEFITKTNSLSTAEFTKETERSAETEFITTIDPHARSEFITMPTNADGRDIKAKNWIITNSSMYMIMHSVDFFEGKAACMVEDNPQSPHLAWIDSESENIFLSEALEGLKSGRTDTDEMAYIGVKIDDNMDLQRIPNDTSQSVIFGSLAKEPLLEHQSCVVLRSDGEWYPMDCYEVIAAICEIDLD